MKTGNKPLAIMQSLPVKNKFLGISRGMVLGLFAGFMLNAGAIDLKQAPEVQSYLQEISKTHGFDLDQLNHWFSQVDFDPTIIKKFQQPPPPPKPWRIYQKKNIASLIEPGMAFSKKYQKILASAERHYGVPAKTIAAIIGIETVYGTHIGNYSAFESLTTYAFHVPRRRPYFESELTAFLLLSREQNWDIFKVQSSVDGGLGIPQFMPSSYRRFAVDADGNGKMNLFTNFNDAIASVGNYLKKAGWQKGEPIAVPAKILVPEKYKALLKEDGTPKFTLQTLRSYGIAPLKSAPRNLKTGVVFFEGKKGLEVWLTFPNYLVIRSYNRSPAYDVAVAELGNLMVKRKSG